MDPRSEQQVWRYRVRIVGDDKTVVQAVVRLSDSQRAHVLSYSACAGASPKFSGPDSPIARSFALERVRLPDGFSFSVENEESYQIDFIPLRVVGPGDACAGGGGVSGASPLPADLPSGADVLNSLANLKFENPIDKLFV